MGTTWWGHINTLCIPKHSLPSWSPGAEGVVTYLLPTPLLAFTTHCCSLAKHPHALNVSELWGNRTQLFTNCIDYDQSEESLSFPASTPTGQLGAHNHRFPCQPIREPPSLEIPLQPGLFPPLLHCQFHSQITVPNKRLLQFEFLNQVTLALSPWHFPMSIHRNRTGPGSGCGPGSWVRGLAGHFRF